ncbi:MAG TPA: hypothetical protein VF406_02490, partial [Thermodesulfobacteriota bacterium]
MGAERPMNPDALVFAEGLYAEFLRDPASVPPDWRRYFEQLGDGAAEARLGPSFKPRSVFNAAGNGAEGSVASRVALAPSRGSAANGAPLAAPKVVALEPSAAAPNAVDARVEALVRAYRVRGHMIAQIDPLGMPRRMPPELDPAFFGFSEA